MSQFGRSSTALEIIKHQDLSGKTAIVTGGTSGIGKEMARALAAAGAEVILPTRNIEYGSAIADHLITDTGNSKVRIYEMDLADFDSVRRFADNFMTEYPRLEILINNAGIMASPLARTVQGYELHFAVNHLGHFLLTAALAPALAASASCRVVTLSSLAHRLSPVHFEDIHFDSRPYDKWVAYAQSKSANALFAFALNERLRTCGGLAFSVHPGAILSNLQCYKRQEEMQALGGLDDKGVTRKGFKTPAQGAATAIWAATSRDLLHLGGAYCEDCQLAEPATDGNESRGVHAHARDPEAAAQLWEVSERLVDHPFTLPLPGFRVQAAGAVQ
ncbi:SDR family NAD(P)-dependent oxidoreductase [Proteobacteria bacterium 005FR1]|nr:SDR family NAD(P)-dependent oxidoreductase [Proteobacteria bacterium 005FR1]